MNFIPYGRQWVDADDINAVINVLQGDHLTTGPAVEAFETALQGLVKSRFATVCSSGTAALHLAMLALNFRPGDVAIVPSMTFAATANAVRYVGGDVVFADVDPRDGLMHAEHFEAALKRAQGRNVRAVLPVFLAGQGADVAELQELAGRHGIAVIEDASHAIGSQYRDGGSQWRVGQCGHSMATVFSFHPVKTIAMGEGGAVTTNDPEFANRVARLRVHGIERREDHLVNETAAHDADGALNPWYYELLELGYNYRATDIQCALGLSQLRKIEKFVSRRAELVKRYDDLLATSVPQAKPVARTPQWMPAWHLYPVLLDFAAIGQSRASVMRAIREHGIGTQVHYIPLHRQPYYRGLYGDMSLPGAERYYAQTLSLPLFPQLSDDDQDRVIDALASVLSH